MNQWKVKKKMKNRSLILMMILSLMLGMVHTVLASSDYEPDRKGSIIATSGRLENIDIIKSDYLASTQIQATNLNTNNLDVANKASIAGFELKSATTESATMDSKEVSLQIITPTIEYVDSIGTYIGGS